MYCLDIVQIHHPQRSPMLLFVHTLRYHSHRILHLPQSCHHLYRVCLSSLFLDLGVLDVH